MSDSDNPSLPELRQRMADGLMAMVELGKHYLSEENFQAASLHFGAATIFEHPEAMFYLAQMHLNGDGVEHDNKNAVAFLIDLASKGYEPASDLLKRLWANDVCREQITAFNQEVFTQHLKQAEQGDTDSMVQAATILLTFLVDGDGPSAEAIAQAKDLLTKAALHGNEMAANLLHSFGRDTDSR